MQIKSIFDLKRQKPDFLNEQEYRQYWRVIESEIAAGLVNYGGGSDYLRDLILYLQGGGGYFDTDVTMVNPAPLKNNTEDVIGTIYSPYGFMASYIDQEYSGSNSILFSIKKHPILKDKMLRSLLNNLENPDEIVQSKRAPERQGAANPRRDLTVQWSGPRVLWGDVITNDVEKAIYNIAKKHNISFETFSTYGTRDITDDQIAFIMHPFSVKSIRKMPQSIREELMKRAEGNIAAAKRIGRPLPKCIRNMFLIGEGLVVYDGFEASWLNTNQSLPKPFTVEDIKI